MMEGLLIPAAVAIKDELVSLILSQIPSGVTQIILYGSGEQADRFRTGESDLDISVLVDDITMVSIAVRRDIRRLLNGSFPGPWTHIAIDCPRRCDYERLRAYELAFESRVLNGTVLFDDGHAFIGEILCRTNAKTAYFTRLITNAHFWQYDFLLTHKNYPVPLSAVWSATRAACRGLHAILTCEDIDFSPKVIRWQPRAHCALVGQCAQIPHHVLVAAHDLPVGLAKLEQHEIEGVEAADEEGHRALFEKALVSTKIIVDHCTEYAKTKLGIDISPLTMEGGTK